MTRSLTAALALAIAFAASPVTAGGSHDAYKYMSPEERRAYTQSLTPAQREAKRAQHQAQFEAKLQQMTPEQRQRALAWKAELQRRQAAQHSQK
ncbi:MAG: hypothetical protein Alpg2KO_23730 [Alphaproteobacteria bacterium]